tara:strand:- start:53 stop:697 length:645 start_codon:yes stop_codon:yes gene_type:complete
MFKRLNTGGENLSPQQIRNSSIRLLNADFNDFIIRMSKDLNYKNCTQYLSYEQQLEAYNEELVLRFFALKNDRENFVHGVSDFLTEYMESVSDQELGRNKHFNYSLEEVTFKKTFEVLSLSIGEYAFGYANRSKNLVRGFGIYQYEAFTIGIQCVLDKLNSSDHVQMKKLQAEITSIKKELAFIALTTGGGKNSRGQLKQRVEFVEEKLRLGFL